MVEVKMRYVSDKKPRLPVPPDLLEKRPDLVDVTVEGGKIIGRIKSYR